MTNGEFVSRIVNDIRSVNKDDVVPKKWILNIGKSKAKTYVAQHWFDLGLYEDASIVTYIPCLEMVEVKAIDCCDDLIPICKTLYRSKKRIPGLIGIASGTSSIIRITNIDNSRIFTRTTLRDFINDKQRMFSGVGDQFVYYVEDGYIYLPEETAAKINVKLITIEKREAMKLSSCGDSHDFDFCKSAWDDEFVAPLKLMEAIATQTLQEVLSRVQTPEDENPNMDSNEKTRTV